MYSPEGLVGRARLATIELAELSIRTTEHVINEVGGRGGDVFVAIGVPAVIARVRPGGLEPLAGLDQEFLSTLALSPDGATLAFARDTRRRDASDRDEGQELWFWRLADHAGAPVLSLPPEHFIFSLAWTGDDVLVAQVAGRLGQQPEIWEIRESVVTRRFRASGSWFYPLPDGRVIQVPKAYDAQYQRVSITPHVRELNGSGRRDLETDWEPLALSPNGTQILMARAKYSRNRAEVTLLGVAPVEDLRAITIVGGVPGGLFGAVWRSLEDSKD